MLGSGLPAMRVKALILLSALFVFPCALFAQEGTPEESEPEVQETQAQEVEAEQITLPDEPASPFQEFDPSEEISEDFSVPFPVDI